MAEQKQKNIAAPTNPIGYVTQFPNDFGMWDQFEKVRDLVWPNSVGVYTRMGREDSRVWSVLAAIAMPIRTTAWRIDKAGASDEVTKFVAQNLGLPINGAEEAEQPTRRTRGKFNWQTHLALAMKMLQFGHAFFEQVYEIGDDGRAHLVRLAPRPPETISRIGVNQDGTLEFVQQYPSGLYQSVGEGNNIPIVKGWGSVGGPPIPANRLVAYVYEQTPGVWTGTSLLRPAYKHWLLKDDLLRIQAATFRRNGMGVPVITASEAESEDQKRLDLYSKIASTYRGGYNAGIALPYGAEFKLQGVDGQLIEMQQGIEYHDKAIALAALAHFLNLDRGGSYALASTQEDTFTAGVNSTAELVRSTAQAEVVEDLVSVNWGDDEPAPVLMFDAIGSGQDGSALALQMLAGAGLLHPDPTLEAFERQRRGLPAADPEAAAEAAADQVDSQPVAPPTPGTEPMKTEGPVVPFRGAVSASIAEVEAMRKQLYPFSDDEQRRRPVTIHPNGQLTIW